MIIQPTRENLNSLKKIKNRLTYWHTADFFPFDHELADSLTDTAFALMDIEDEEKFTSGKIVVKAARKAGISAKQYLEQLSNYELVMLTPICIWQEDEHGNFKYSLSSSLNGIENSNIKVC